MQGQKLTISRGGGGETQPVPIRRATPPREAPAQDGHATDPHLVHHRLAALERLDALRTAGVLSQSEFEAEKALVLRMPARELALRETAAARGPSLVGRLLDWRLLAMGAAAGMALSAVTAPHELSKLFGEAARLLG